MAVICVARELAALGEETVHCLAKLIGYKPVDKIYLENKMTEHGIAPEVRAKYDEKKPKFWASLSQDRDDYLHFLKKIVYEEASENDIIISGRGGFAIFGGIPGVITIKMVAPKDIRIKRICARFGCDEKRAEQLMRQQDADSVGFHDYFFNLDWNDPIHFNMTLNTGMMSSEEAAFLIDQYRKKVITNEAAAICKQRMNELRLGHEIVTEILYARAIPVHFVEADVRGTEATIHGVANNQTAIEAASVAAASVSGISKVNNQIQIIQEYTVMP